MKDVLSKEQVRNIIAGVSRLVQPDEISERADLGCHICALGNTCETLRAENARLRAIEAAAEGLAMGAVDMGDYWYVRRCDMPALETALDAEEVRGGV